MNISNRQKPTENKSGKKQMLVRVNITERKNTTDGPFVIGKIEVTKHEQMKINRT